MSSPLDAFLIDLHNQTILDLATGSGQWIHVMLPYVPSDNRIIGIDTMAVAIERAKQHFQHAVNVSFLVGDVYHLPFENESIDVVTISNSIHHFGDHSSLFSEIKRVLKPQGYFLVAEMVCDALTRAQISHRKLHHFAAQMDQLRGEYHGMTYTQQELAQIVSHHLGFPTIFGVLEGVKPVALRDEKTIQGLIETSKQILNRIPSSVDRIPYQKQQQSWEHYVLRHGFASASTFLLLTQKP